MTSGLLERWEYIRGNLMRKLIEMFEVLKFQKRIVAAAIIWGNTVVYIFKVDEMKIENQEDVLLNASLE